MKSRSLRTATLFALLMLAEPISPRPGAQEAKPKQGETRLSCVVVLHIGMQRKQVRPMILYADEYGWNRRAKVLRPEQMQDLLSKSCDVRTLDKLVSTAVAIEGWITPGEEG